MNLTLNHRPETVETNKQSITDAELLVIRNFTYKMLIIKVNDAVVRKDDYSTVSIKEGDNVQVIHLISGG